MIKRMNMPPEITDKRNRLCPASLAGGLDNRFRRWLQNPEKILEPFIKKGMTALDMGCGPGFFTVALAELVGESGRVIAADVQEGMLLRLKNKIKGTELENRITLHKCERDRINLSELVDFALAFYMVHEVPGQTSFFNEIFDLSKPDSEFLIIEPKLFHVSQKAFEDTINNAVASGFQVAEGPKILFSWSALLKKPIMPQDN
jgi:ubiquinone/menaquinone biosynthesis C-methylase UbiE